MKHKIPPIFLSFFVCCLLIAGCQISHYDKTADYLGLLEDNRLVYRTFIKQNAMYYTYDFDTKETVHLGRTEGFHLTYDTASLLNNHLYFYDVISGEGPHAKNAFYDVDLTDNTVSEVAVFEMKPDNKTISTTSSWPFGNTIVTIGYESDSQYCKSSLVYYHTDTKQWSYNSLGVYDSQANTGIYPLSLYADGTSLYLIQKEAIEANQENYYFIQYDTDGNQIRRIPLSGDILHFVEKGGVWSLYVWEDYIYMTNSLAEDFIGHIEGEQITEIAQAALLKSHSLYPEDAPLFYDRYEKYYYTLDTESAALIKQPHQLLTSYPSELIKALANWNYRTHLEQFITAHDTLVTVLYRHNQPEEKILTTRSQIGEITV